MFEQARYIQNSFSVVFPRQPQIRRMANAFEDKLAGGYFPPQIIPVPDDLDPEIPRMIFGSTHGFSQVIVSQINLVLNVTYSPDWQSDIAKGKQYLLERVPLLFEVLKVLEEAKPLFCGLTTRVNLPCQDNDETVLTHLQAVFKWITEQALQDLQIKMTVVKDERFFSNITIANYRSWKLPNPSLGVVRLPANEATERGIQIIGDFNDRYAFNQNSAYYSDITVAKAIIANGLHEVQETVARIGGNEHEEQL